MAICNLMESMPYPFEEHAKDICQKFFDICRGTDSGRKDVFDDFCRRIYPFCLEIHDTGKDLRYESGNETHVSDGDLAKSPLEDLIFDIGNHIAEHVMPFNSAFHATSQALHRMVCDILNEEKFRLGRISFIDEIWPKTGRTNGIQIRRLLGDQRLRGITFSTLLILGDGRFVEEARKILPKDPHNFCRDDIVQYIERYGLHKKPTAPKK